MKRTILLILAMLLPFVLSACSAKLTTVRPAKISELNFQKLRGDFMTKFCTNCGREISDGVAFCTECGAAAPTAAPNPTAEVKPEAAPPPPQAVPSPTYTQSGNGDQPPKGRYGVVGTGTYFGLMFLFAIPVIGWLICILMALASKNENKKHFAKAMMIWIIIGIVLSVVGYFVFRWLGGMITDYINAEFGSQFGDLQELLEQFKQFENGGLIPPTN